MPRFWVLLILVLTGCGLARLDKSASDLSSSKANYEDCLRNQPADSCETLKAIYAADLQEYEARHKAFSNYGASRVYVQQNTVAPAPLQIQPVPMPHTTTCTGNTFFGQPYVTCN